MSKVFEGKVVIAGEDIEQYFELLKKAEEERKPFVDMFEELISEFYEYLVKEKGLSEKTAGKHCSIVDLFKEFIATQTDVWVLTEVTKGMAGTYFDRWYKRKVWGCSSDTHSRKLSLKKFFLFLKTEKEIVNEKVL